MNDRELELYSTEELVREILGRASFRGVVVHMCDDVGNRPEPDEMTFNVRFNRNFEADEIGRLLDVVSRRLPDAV